MLATRRSRGGHTFLIVTHITEQGHKGMHVTRRSSVVVGSTGPPAMRGVGLSLLLLGLALRVGSGLVPTRRSASLTRRWSMSTDVHTAAPLTAQELRQLGARQMPHEAQKKQRAVFCSRSLDLSKTKWSDTTWTTLSSTTLNLCGRHARTSTPSRCCAGKGFPVDDLEFESDLVCRGLVVRAVFARVPRRRDLAPPRRAFFSYITLICGTQIDQELGNLIKVDRFGYVRRAMHGQMRLSTAAVQEIYGRTVVDLREDRYCSSTRSSAVQRAACTRSWSRSSTTGGSRGTRRSPSTRTV